MRINDIISKERSTEIHQLMRDIISGTRSQTMIGTIRAEEILALLECYKAVEQVAWAIRRTHEDF